MSIKRDNIVYFSVTSGNCIERKNIYMCINILMLLYASKAIKKE